MENDARTKEPPLVLKILILGGMALTLLIPLFFIQAQNYALLVGTLGIFVVLALFMLVTRKLDWYALRRKKPAHSPSPPPPSVPPVIEGKQ